MSNDVEYLFEKWWKAESPPGTFDKEQCKVAFFAGLNAAQKKQSKGDKMYCFLFSHKFEFVEIENKHWWRCTRCGQLREIQTVARKPFAP